MGAKFITPARRAMIKYDLYTGNGVDNRNISIGVDLLNKRNSFVIIKSRNAHAAWFRLDHSAVDEAFCFAAEATTSNRIQALTSSGFQIGDDVRINENGIVFTVVAMWQEG